MHDLITGGAGFIGSRLAGRLLAAGHVVTVLDDLSTGRIENLPAAAEGLRVVHGDVRHPGVVGRAMDGADRVFHLAAAVGVRHVAAHPVATLDVNLQGTATVLAAAAERDLPVLVASSSEVYGRSEALPFREDQDLVTGPSTRGRYGYGLSKLLNEHQALAWREETGLGVVVARLFNTVGPGQRGRYGMVLPRFVRQAVEGRPLTIHGSGRQTRSFLHVAETVEALDQLLATPAAHGEIVNVGGQEEVSILELAQRVSRHAGIATLRCAHIALDEVVGRPFDDFARRVPSIDKARQLIGFAPRRDLDGIIAELVAEARTGPPLAASDRKA